MMKLIHEYKNGRRHGLASFFAAYLMTMIRSEKMGFDLITSVPPSQKKMKKRGFDPSQVISRSLSSISNIPYSALMKESGKHGEQKTLGADDRYCNAIDRFVFIGERNLEGKNVILVDDVMTTGATINESARILKKNGAGIVLSLTVARVDIRK
jgi:ComF family protein